MQVTENEMMDHTDSADCSRKPAITTTTATTTVSHFCRQFSKSKRAKKKQQQQNATAAGVVSTSLLPAAIADPPTPQPTTVRRSSLCIRPAIAVDVVHAPPWLVADHFVSEHVVHEHVSVVPEPDYADPVPVAMDDAPPLPPSPATALLDPMTTVECPPISLLSIHVSKHRTYVLVYIILSSNIHRLKIKGIYVMVCWNCSKEHF